MKKRVETLNLNFKKHVTFETCMIKTFNKKGVSLGEEKE